MTKREPTRTDELFVYRAHDIQATHNQVLTARRVEQNADVIATALGAASDIIYQRDMGAEEDNRKCVDAGCELAYEEWVAAAERLAAAEAAHDRAIQVERNLT